MKKQLIALATLALVSDMALAQSSVTVYGNVDVGLLTQNHKSSGGKDIGSANAVESGGISPSIWGFRGTEDLGGGLKASFNLEAHYSADTGAGTGATMFRRQSNVSLSSADWGSFTLGNQYGPAVLAFAATDPRGLRENFSGLYSWAYNSGALTKSVTGTGGNNGNNDVGVFLRNSVAYNHKIGPVGFGAAYSASEMQGAVYSLGLTYSGPVTLSAAYQSTNSPGTSTRLSKLATVGASYTFGDVTGKINYLRGVNKNTPLSETNVGVIGLGVDWKTASNNTAMASVYMAKDKNNTTDKTTTFILSDEYALSKRTTLYGQLAFANAKSGATLLTTVVSGGTLANATTTLLNVGIRHSF